MQTNLSELLKLREGETLDFKQRITSFDKIAKTLCSFANTHGGVVLVGVKDDRTVTGVDPEEEKYMLEHAAKHYCEPMILLDFLELEDEESRVVLMVTIPESSQKPHASRSKNGNWQVYVRQNDKSIPAGNGLIKDMSKGVIQKHAEVKLDKNETKVMHYLSIHERITIPQLARLINFSKRRAGRLLDDMVKNGLIRLFDHEREDYYTS